MAYTSSNEIIGIHREIKTIKPQYNKEAKALFLECPCYASHIWNTNNTVGISNTQQINDTKELNCKIHDINDTFNVPKFSKDMTQRRKCNKGYTTETVSYSLLYDGGHPSMILSKVWIKK